MANKDFKHGMCGTRAYDIWCNMKARCDNPAADFYHIYGGRGITYCSKWSDFVGFWEDMGNTYKDELSLERIDNSSGYSKENCCWIPLGDQPRNRRKAANNTSGFTGVSWKRNRIGTLYACSRWVEQGRDTCRYFSVKKYGPDVAFSLACKCRDAAISKMRENGVSYGINHGK